MLKSLVEFLHKEGEKEVRLICEPDTATVVVKNALIKFSAVIQHIEETAAKNQQEKEKEAQAPEEDVVPSSKI